MGLGGHPWIYLIESSVFRWLDYDHDIACWNLSLLLSLPPLPYLQYPYFSVVPPSLSSPVSSPPISPSQTVKPLPQLSAFMPISSRWLATLTATIFNQDESNTFLLFFSFSLLHYALVFSSWLCLSSCRVLITLFYLLPLIHKHTHTYSFFSLRYGYLLLSVSFSSYLTNMISSI